MLVFIAHIVEIFDHQAHMIAEKVKIILIFKYFGGIEKAKLTDHKGIMPLAEEAAEKMGTNIVILPSKLPKHLF